MKKDLLDAFTGKRSNYKESIITPNTSCGSLKGFSTGSVSSQTSASTNQDESSIEFCSGNLSSFSSSSKKAFQPPLPLTASPSYHRTITEREASKRKSRTTTKQGKQTAGKMSVSVSSGQLQYNPIDLTAGVPSRRPTPCFDSRDSNTICRSQIDRNSQNHCANPYIPSDIPIKVEDQTQQDPILSVSTTGTHPDTTVNRSIRATFEFMKRINRNIDDCSQNDDETDYGVEAEYDYQFHQAGSENCTNIDKERCTTANDTSAARRNMVWNRKDLFYPFQSSSDKIIDSTASSACSYDKPRKKCVAFIEPVVKASCEATQKSFGKLAAATPFLPTHKSKNSNDFTDPELFESVSKVLVGLDDFGSLWDDEDDGDNTINYIKSHLTRDGVTDNFTGRKFEC